MVKRRRERCDETKTTCFTGVSRETGTDRGVSTMLSTGNFVCFGGAGHAGPRDAYGVYGSTKSVIRVAAYCRVSTDKEDQTNSFHSQRQYFRDCIDRNPDWVLEQIYADEGISGTSTRKREAFNRMIADARAGKLDLILTKEVSRFARNTLDTLEYTRELRKLGVGVIFLLDNINTLDQDGELRLTIMSSIAQEESRKTSERVKWGQTRRMEQGVVFGGSLLGYRVHDGTIEIEPEEAKLVQYVFQQYLVEGKGSSVIARELRETGIKSRFGRCDWSAGTVLKILKNEKYCGDLLQKKTYTPDYLSHAKKTNRGQERKILIRDHHEPIIDRKTWNDVQSEIQQRRKGSKNSCITSGGLPLSGKIWCGRCGTQFTARQKKSGSQTYRLWRCKKALCDGSEEYVDGHGNALGCRIGRQLREDDAYRMLDCALGSIMIDRVAIEKRIAAVLEHQFRCGQEKLRSEIIRIESKKEQLLESYLDNTISKHDLLFMNKRYDKDIEQLRSKIKKQQMEKQSDQTERDITSAIQEIMATPNLAFCGRLLDHITVYEDGRAEICFCFQPTCWTFAFGCHVGHDDSSVPISVNNPLASGKGME